MCPKVAGYVFANYMRAEARGLAPNGRLGPIPKGRKSAEPRSEAAAGRPLLSSAPGVLETLVAECRKRDERTQHAAEMREVRDALLLPNTPLASSMPA